MDAEQADPEPPTNPTQSQQPNNMPIEESYDSVAEARLTLQNEYLSSLEGRIEKRKKPIVIGAIVFLILLVIFAVLSFTVWEVTPFGIGLSIVALVPIFALIYMKKKYYGASNGGVLGGLENNNQILAFNLSDYNHIY